MESNFHSSYKLQRHNRQRTSVLARILLRRSHATLGLSFLCDCARRRRYRFLNSRRGRGWISKIMFFLFLFLCLLTLIGHEVRQTRS